MKSRSLQRSPPPATRTGTGPHTAPAVNLSALRLAIPSGIMLPQSNACQTRGKASDASDPRRLLDRKRHDASTVIVFAPSE